MKRSVEEVVGERDLGLCIDIGSSGVRCAAFSIMVKGKCGPNADGSPPTLVPETMVKYSLDFIGAQGIGQASKVITAVEECLDRCVAILREFGLAQRVVALGFASFAMSWLGLDSNGAPCTPVYTYAQSSQTLREAVEELLTSAGQQIKCDIWQRTGAPWFHNSYAAPRMLQHLKHDSTAGVCSWTTLTSFLLSRWTESTKERAIVSLSEASWTGMLNLRTLSWDTVLIDLLQQRGFDPATLPQICDYCEYSRVISSCSKFGRTWKELVGAKLFLGVGDGACANVGSGSVDATTVAVTVGTTAAVRMVVPDGWIDRFTPCGLWIYRIDRKRLLLGGAISDGGSFMDWVCERLGGAMGPVDRSKLEADALLVPAASHGIIMLPFLSGERAPGWDDAAVGTISGLKRGTDAPSLARAAVEGVVYRLATILDLMNISQDIPVIASGGALQSSKLWRSIACDTFNRDVAVSHSGEATLTGVAYLMAEALSDWTAAGHFSGGQLATASDWVHPCYENHMKHSKAKREQNKLQNVLAGAARQSVNTEDL